MSGNNLACAVCVAGVCQSIAGLCDASAKEECMTPRQVVEEWIDPLGLRGCGFFTVREAGSLFSEAIGIG